MLSPADLPTELQIEILVLAAKLCSFTAKSLALSGLWVADVTRPVRLEIITVYTPKDDLESLRDLLCNSPAAAAAVRSLWIATNRGIEVERQLVPDILRACTGLSQLSCRLTGLKMLCDTGDALPWPRAHSLQLTLLDQMAQPRPIPWKPLWAHILGGCHGAAFLQHITHLNLRHYHFAFEKGFPANELPRLTHLAMGARNPHPRWHHWRERMPNYHEQLRDFAVPLDRMKLQLTMAVFVLRPDKFNKVPYPLFRELLRTAQGYHSSSNLLVFRMDNREEELKFWRKNTFEGEDIWSLAEKQNSLYSENIE